jgi:hypothetical protein
MNPSTSQRSAFFAMLGPVAASTVSAGIADQPRPDTSKVTSMNPPPHVHRLAGYPMGSTSPAARIGLNGRSTYDSYGRDMRENGDPTCPPIRKQHHEYAG